MKSSTNRLPLEKIDEICCAATTQSWVFCDFDENDKGAKLNLSAATYESVYVLAGKFSTGGNARPAIDPRCRGG